MSSDLRKKSNLIIDIEAKYDNICEINEIYRDNDHDEPIELDYKISVFKFCSMISILIIYTPIIITDLYFGFTDSMCSKKEPDDLSISIKLYLLVSGFISIAVMITYLYLFCIGNMDDFKFCIFCCGSISIILMSLFTIVWNILGAIVFWGYIYGNENCNKTFSTYVFVSLIIKLGATLFGILSNKKEDKE